MLAFPPCIENTHRDGGTPGSFAECLPVSLSSERGLLSLRLFQLWLCVPSSHAACSWLQKSCKLWLCLTEGLSHHFPSTFLSVIYRYATLVYMQLIAPVGILSALSGHPSLVRVLELSPGDDTRGCWVACHTGTSILLSFLALC